MSVEQPEPLTFFVHLQKTAGTSVTRMLRDSFGRPAIYPDNSDGDPVQRVISVRHMLDRWHARREEIRVIAGHFPLCATELLDVPVRTFSVLREPVERTASYLRHHRKTTPADAHLSLEEIYGDPDRFDGLIHNHMVKMFSLTPAEMTNDVLTHVEFTEGHLDRAKQNLERIDVLGLQDRLDEFCADLDATFGWDLGPPLHMNRTERSELPIALRDRIVEDNALDIEFYEYAVRLHETRRSRVSK